MSCHKNKVSFYPNLALSVPGRWCFFNPLPFEKWDIYHQILSLFGKKPYKLNYSLVENCLKITGTERVNA